MTQAKKLEVLYYEKEIQGAATSFENAIDN